MGRRRQKAIPQDDLTRVVDALPGLVWTALSDGHFDFVNQRWCEYTGLNHGDSYGLGWQTAVHSEDLPALLERWKSILNSGEPGEIEARFRRFDGEYRCFLIRAVPTHDGRGNVTRWYGINIDVNDRASERQRSHVALAHALNELKEPESSLRTIVDTIPTIAWCTLPDGSGEFWNQRWYDYTGVSQEDARDQGWQKLIHPDDLPNVRDTWFSNLAAGRAGEVEGRLRRFDGEYRWFLFRYEPLRDETGNIVNWYGSDIDIEDRKRAEALLAGEKRLLEMVASGSPLPIVLDALCSLVDSTAAGCFSSVLLVDSTSTKIAYAAAPGLPASYKEFLKGRPVTCTEGPCGTALVLNTQVIVPDVEFDTRWEPDGFPAVALSYGIKSCWSSPVRSLTGELLGTFTITRRETGSPTAFHQALIEQFTHIASIAIGRTRSEEALKRNEALLKEAQRISSTGSFSWRVATNEITWSEEAYRMYGLDPEEPATLEAILSRTHPEDVHLSREIIERARSGVEDFDFERRLVMPDQSIKYLHVLAHGIRNEDGELELFGTLHDITSRRLTEEALAKARSELARVARVTSLGTLTASIAHEINQPLSGIITNASTCLRMLNAEPPNIAGARETARRTIRDGDRASEVITRLRTLFAKKTSTSEFVDLNDATREVIALMMSELRRNRVIVKEELADDLPTIMGDRVQLQQVILNLLLNASEAMNSIDDRPRQVVIKTERVEGDRVRLSVQDVGVGFESQALGKIFEAFYTTKSGGMGIGLSVSRSIIESHSGCLWASANDGPGSTFSFSLPQTSEVRLSDSLADGTAALTDEERNKRNRLIWSKVN
jgi:PAS domain S-box-containing protein